MFTSWPGAPLCTPDPHRKAVRSGTSNGQTCALEHSLVARGNQDHSTILLEEKRYKDAFITMVITVGILDNGGYYFLPGQFLYLYFHSFRPEERALQMSQGLYASFKKVLFLFSKGQGHQVIFSLVKCTL